MPICVDCQRWSPVRLKACPDCSGALLPEPDWATSDPELAKLEYLARSAHRRKDGAELAMLRRQYEEMRRRLLPAFEAAEARRVAGLPTAARAAGLTVGEYEARVARERRDRRALTEKLREQDWKDYSAGLITQDEYERRDRARGERNAEAEASAAGLSVRAYKAQLGRDERDREWRLHPKWADSDWLWAWLIATTAALLLTVVIGLIMTLALILGGRSPLAAIGGMVVGGLAGLIVGQAIFFAAGAILERLAPVSGVARQVGEYVLEGALCLLVLLTAGLAVVVALRLG